jgi:serine protease Do
VYKPITATICEALGRGVSPSAIMPDGEESQDLFLFHDPFNLRRAVVPVLLNDADGVMRGMGTAFHIDGWGTFLTAAHVVDAVRNHAKPGSTKGNEKQFSFGPHGVHAVLLLGMGLVFGTMGVPDEALALVSGIRMPIRERDNPLALLAGQVDLEAASDVSVLHLAKNVPEAWVGTLSIRLRGWKPKVGDTVVALGFPKLQCQAVDEEAIRYLLSDGMSAAYGRIVTSHPHGRLGDPTPVIEVDAHWPSGMSGGPVLNDCGEVIGIVSRSSTPSEGLLGKGYAAGLQLMPWLRNWLPNVDASNPGWRLGWAVVESSSGDVIAFYKEKSAALEHQERLGNSYAASMGSQRIGTAEFVTYTYPQE